MNNNLEYYSIQENVFSSIENKVMPLLKEVIQNVSKTEEFDSNLNKLKLIKSSLTDLNSKFYKKLSKYGLTYTEMKVCNMIKSKKSLRAISEEFGISLNTVKVHCRNIRKKLGVTYSKTALKNHFITWH